MVAGPIQRPRHLLGQLNAKQPLTAARPSEAAWLPRHRLGADCRADSLPGALKARSRCPVHVA